MVDVFRAALDAKLLSIMIVIANERGYTSGLDALTVELRLNIEEQAEQAIIDWTVARNSTPRTVTPVTNLQHLLHEYCAIADHLERRA